MSGKKDLAEGHSNYALTAEFCFGHNLAIIYYYNKELQIT